MKLTLELLATLHCNLAAYAELLSRETGQADGGSDLHLGILPNYRTIGAAAPLLLVLARIGQGLSLGGESMGSVAFIVEWAPKMCRGFIGSFQHVGSGLGLLLGCLTVATLTSHCRHRIFRTGDGESRFRLA